MFHNIPDELKALPQWVVWRYEEAEEGGKPTKIPLNPKNGKTARTNDPSTWGTFDEACACIEHNLAEGIGFVFSKDDDYMGIDLDNPYEKNPDGSDKYEDQNGIMEMQKRIFKGFETYAEISPSGTGLHLITKGRLPNGRRRMSVEMYSEGRFFTMTGNVYADRKEIKHDQTISDRTKILWEQLGGGPEKTFHDGHAPQKYSDDEICKQMFAAKNAETVQILCSDDWRVRYPSQSEADLAFVNIIAFYTQNREQITRLFRTSPLGQRNKQTTIRGKSYINYMIDKSFDRMLPPVDLDGLRNQVEAAIAQAHAINARPKVQAIPINYTPTKVTDDGEGGTHMAPPDLPDGSGAFKKPIGLVGEIAEFIYKASARPTAEIAICAAIGLMAGICGRSYNVSNTGLNHYLLLLASTGTGKEAMAGGIEKLMLQVHKRQNGAYDFVGPGEIASSQALIKYMSKDCKNSFVSVVGEFGLYLQEMTSMHASPHKHALKRLMLDLYNKSGINDVVRPSIFADSDKNTALLKAPNYTLLGESTAERFYEGLDEMMITEGLLPRFTIVEYTGERPYYNENHAKHKPPDRLVDSVAQLCAHSIMMNAANEAIPVKTTDEVAHMFRQFNLDCDNRMRGAREVTKNLWNRAHVKSMKLSALIAVGCNIYAPIITAEIAQWAINIVIAECSSMLTRFSSGEIGTNSEEVNQMKEACRVVRDYLTLPWSDVQNYAPSAQMHQERVLPFAYVQRRLAAMAVFRKDRIGATNAIKRVFDTLVTRGDIAAISPIVAHQRFNSSAKCFAITIPRTFGL